MGKVAYTSMAILKSVDDHLGIFTGSWIPAPFSSTLDDECLFASLFEFTGIFSINVTSTLKGEPTMRIADKEGV